MTQGNYPTGYPQQPQQYPHRQYAQYPPGQYPGGTGYYAPEPLKHSGLGIISLLLAILAGVGFVITMIVAVVVMADDPKVFDNEQAPATMILGACVILCGLVSLIGVGLGIGGLVEKNRKKVFPTIGLVVNGLGILLLICLAILGSIG